MTNFHKYLPMPIIQKQLFRGVLSKKCCKNMQQIYRRTSMLKCDLNKVALQLYRNHTLAQLFSCKFAAYFQNTFSQEHLQRAAPEKIHSSLLSIAEAKFILGIIYNAVRNVYVFEVFLVHIFHTGTEYGEILRILFTQCKL